MLGTAQGEELSSQVIYCNSQKGHGVQDVQVARQPEALDTTINYQGRTIQISTKGSMGEIILLYYFSFAQDP